jgi:serine phosphatase RsbU (regulator of sigma subunit)
MLAALSGPETCSVLLRPPGPVTIGRSNHHHLPLNDTRVSRDHALLTWSVGGPQEDPQSGGEWRIVDSGSRHGTWLNGLRLTPQRPLPIRAGDRLVISPWTFQVVPAGQAPVSEPSLATIADAPNTTVTRIDAQLVDLLAQERLALLLRCANAIHSARDEAALAESIVDAAVTGTGYTNAALLRAGDQIDQLTLVAHRGRIVSADSSTQLSRSLLQQASTGTPARLTRRGDLAPVAVSIVELEIEEALCIPILLEGSVAGFLYLDNRGGRATRQTGDAAGFAVGLARLAALAWANLRRVEAERRSARMEAELSAAGRMQSLLLPPHDGVSGPFRYTGQSRPGRYVGGDFFDVIPLSRDRLAIAVGDVAGKGVEAAVLITASQGFLHAALQDHGDPGRAVTELNRYVFPRTPGGKFITLWIAVLDHQARAMHAVDAGHGHAYLLAPDGAVSPVPIPKSFPIAIMEETKYDAHRVELPATGRLLVLSDGLLEECAPPREGEPEQDRRAHQFSVAGVQACLRNVPAGADEVTALFDAVEKHAGTHQLADDATALIVRW